MQGIEFWAVNTDVQALAHHCCQNRMQIGSEVTRGLGCGGNPEIGKAAALESQEGLKQVGGGMVGTIQYQLPATTQLIPGAVTAMHLQNT